MKPFPNILLGAALLAAATGTLAQQSFSLEGAVIDSRSSQNLGVISERGDLASLFRAQKTMSFGILRAAGISLEQLPPDVRARIERFQTTNIDAFRAFSEGLDLKDQGKFVEAKERFRRAAELDPGFALATEQQQAMPDVNLGVAVTTRAVLSAAAGAAVDKGKASVVVDTARAAAAIAAGATVVVVNVPPSTDPKKDINYSVNDTGGTEQFLPRLVAGYAYSQRLATGVAVSVANAQEWRGDAYRTGTGANAGVLEALGTSGDFQALRQGAANQPGPGTPLNDGSVAYWGAWLSAPGASATVSAGGVPASAPALGRFDYVFGNATAQMPGTGTATYTAVPGAGSLGVNAGSIQVNFVQREVAVQNLGFSLDGLAFSGMNGVARYDNTTVGSGSAAGTFAARYTSGQCAGCSAFAPTASSFNGSFIGRNADGLVFSSILITGNPGGSTSAGVQLLTRPPP